MLAGLRALMPLLVFLSLTVVSTGIDRRRVAYLLTAQIAFGFAALAISAGRSKAVTTAVSWASVTVDLLVVASLMWVTGGIEGPLSFLFASEALAVGLVFSAGAGARVLAGSAIGLGAIHLVSPGSPSRIIEITGTLFVAAIGIGLSAVLQREARRRSFELQTIRRIALDIQDSLSLEEILSDLCRGVVHDLRFTEAVVLLPKDGGLYTAGSCGVRGRTDVVLPERGPLAEARGMDRVVIVSSDKACEGGELVPLLGPRGYIALPMAHEGLLVVTRDGKRHRLTRYRGRGRVRAHEVEPLISLAQQATVAVGNARLHAHVTAMAVTDQLTDLANHREFQRMLALECERQQRYASHRTPGHQLSVLVLDIDHFKSVNDRFGHPAGDQVLKGVARALQSAVRSIDTVARYGGEEFAIVLPETGEEGARQVADRARRAVEQMVIRVDDRNLRITVSGGIATSPEDGMTPTQLVAAADASLYRSKSGGRNRITHSSDVTTRLRPRKSSKTLARRRPTKTRKSA